MASMAIGAAARLVGTSISNLRALTNAGRISAFETPGGHRRYDPELLQREWDRVRNRDTDTHRPLARRDYDLAGLLEDKVWAEVRDDIQNAGGAIPEPARSVLGYAVTEMVNNAIDHSGGARVTVTATQRDGMIHIRIDDDGVGVFARIASGFGFDDAADAVVEITKGKRTTAATRHSGEGIFFTSKAVDLFEIAANGFRVAFDNRIGDVATGSSTGRGTSVELSVARDTERTLLEVFAAYSEAQGDDEGAFTVSAPIVKLVTRQGEFISRSEAKRFAAGLDEFTRVILDFEGVPLLGQGFADELFRVWASAHPGTRLEVIGATPGVRLMIDRVDRP